jgi:hypothetical protein
VHRAGAGRDHPITALVAVLPGDGPHSVPQHFTTLKGWLRERAIDAQTRLSDIPQRRGKGDPAALSDFNLRFLDFQF